MTSRPPDSAAPRRTTNILLLIIRFLVSGGLLTYLIWKANPASIWATWQQADLRLLALAALIQVLCIAISALKWGVLLRAHNQQQPYSWLLGIYFVGQFANNFLPTSVGGDAIRIVQLGRRIGSYAQSSASVFMERLTGFLALSLIANVALLITSTDLLGARLVNEPTLTLLALGFTLVAVAAVAASFSAPWLLRRFHRYLPKTARKPLQSIASSLGIYAADRGAMIRAMGLSLLFHTLWIGLHYVCGLALHIQAPLLLFALMVPLTDIVGLAPIFVNNLGAREMVFTLYLSQIGVMSGTALALAFTAFTVRLTVSSLGGLVLLFGGASMRGATGADTTTSTEPSGPRH
ncbi:flippase-like domain-containing protein [Oscillochloris sp. ZM17-4]|uniref:lysylphosphatidylglycerol synthase transmembrane domain-containing protein n=1 Tax=Oscillochloris sp. ZM17-4 TaxID=2866714 RepID=UPI001C72C5DC|nr:lysylphosphatidylglycerol synthase transmembrane domain-containing protein [Oscillochloris sp. ZM17-4]MBX0327852.1 flippase-like domain-containing protein [Oscillochloris sp. ZM17-4]